MTQPVDEEIVFSPFVDEIPQNPDGKSALQLDDSKFRELTEDELAEMEADDPGTGMTAEEIDAFLGAELSTEAGEAPDDGLVAGAGRLWRSIKAKKQERDRAGRFGDSDGPDLPAAARLGSAIDAALGARLNRGEGFGDDQQSQQLKSAIKKWVDYGPERAGLMEEVAEGMRDPNAQTEGALLARVVASAPALDAPLYRGLYDADPELIPAQGKTIDLGPTAFTTDAQIASLFAAGSEGPGSANATGIRATPRTTVVMRVSPGSRALKVDHVSPAELQYGKEHLALGRYRVVSRKDNPVENVDIRGRRSTTNHIELELEQIA